MMYIQLAQPYRDYDRVRITEAHFVKAANGDRLNFKYEICRKVGSDHEKLFDKVLNVIEQSEIDDLAQVNPDSSLTIWDNMAKKFLQKLIDNGIEAGTLETE